MVNLLTSGIREISRPPGRPGNRREVTAGSQGDRFTEPAEIIDELSCARPGPGQDRAVIAPNVIRRWRGEERKRVEDPMSPYVYLTSVLGQQPGVDSSPGALLPHACYGGGEVALAGGCVCGREKDRVPMGFRCSVVGCKVL